MARLYEGSLWRRKTVAPRSVISLRPGPALAHCWERPGTWKRTLSRPGARSVEGSVSSMLGTLLVQRNASAGADVAGAQRFFVFDDVEPTLPGHLLHSDGRFGFLVVRGVGPGVLGRNAVGEHKITRHI